jgi:tetratricopeptide (TPR) repeat protein
VTFSVIDKGVIAADTPAILRRLEENLATYKPDMVVAMMGFNDRRIVYYDDIPEAGTPLFQHCKTYRLLRLLYSRVVKKPQSIPDLQDQGADIGSQEPSQDRSRLLAKEAELAKALENNPQDDLTLSRLAETRYRLGRVSEAEQGYKKAIALNPQNDWASSRLAELWRREGRIPEAEALFRKAIALNPQNDWAYNRLGALLYNKGKIPETEALWEEAVRLNPKNREIYGWLGRLYKNNNRVSEAEAAYRKAVEVGPEDDATWTELADFYWQEGKLSQAEEVLRECLAQNPRNVVASKMLERLCRETHRIELAEAYKKKRDALKPHEYRAIAVNNYRRLKETLDKKGVRLVCVQYPMRSVEPLKKIFSGERGVVFVDNEKVFKNAVRNARYHEYFVDIFGGDFGHCTEKGNRLLAENIANVILKEVFGK